MTYRVTDFGERRSSGMGGPESEVEIVIRYCGRERCFSIRERDDVNLRNVGYRPLQRIVSSEALLALDRVLYDAR